MDTAIDVIVASGNASRPLAAFASIRVLFEQQEERFSRFRPTSLVSRLNGGESIDDPWLATICRKSLEAHAFTLGAFNPLILPSLERAGYDRAFSEVSGGDPQPATAPDPRAAIFIEGDTVSLRAGRLDLGGIAKGWTVDLAVESIRGQFSGVFINAGGDIRCSGGESSLPGWDAVIASPGSGEDVWSGRLEGALATSTTLQRRWQTRGGQIAHHIIDPATGLPASGSWVQVSAWAPEAWRAECWAKAAIVRGKPLVPAALAAGVALLALDDVGGLERIGA